MKYVKWVLEDGWFILKNYWGWMRKYSHHPEKYPFDLRYKKMRQFLLEFAERLNIKLYVEGIDEVDLDSVSFFAPNHQSFFDPLCMIMTLDTNTSFVAKDEARKYPFVCDAIRSLQGIFMKRDDLRNSLKVIRYVEGSLVNDEKSWVVFPEGMRTRNAGYEMNEFKHGTFKIALDSHKNLVPVAIWGSFRILDTHVHLKEYPVQIKFLKTIPYEEYKDLNSAKLAQKVEKLVHDTVEEMKIEDKKLLANIKK